MIVPMPCSRSTSGANVIDRKPPAAAALRVNSGVSGAATSGISTIRRSSIASAEGARSRLNGIGYIERTRSTSKPEIEAAVAPQYSLSSFRIVIVAEQGSNSFAALLTIASNPGCTSDGELAMTFNISAVAACCSRASFRSLLGPETERRLTRVAAGAVRGLVLVVLRPFAGPALRAFAALVLPPVLDGRAISAPRVKKAILTGYAVLQEGADWAGSQVASGSGQCLFRINRVGLAVCRPLPIHPE